MTKPLKILFIPVSSAQGTGEYMRSLIIALAIKQQWPDSNIRFVLNKHAPYASQCPFPADLLEQSATKEVAAVKQILASFLPNVTVFDCSGRASQVRFAHHCGSKVVFISQHKKKRRRGFSIGRLPYLDAHWITQFQFVDGGLSLLERLKLAVFRGKTPQFIGPVFSPAAAQLPEHLAVISQKPYVVWAAGGGGHLYQGKMATEVFYQAATLLNDAKLQHIVITGPNYQGELPNHPGIICQKALPNPELIRLLQDARLVVCGGGDIMGQAIALQKPVVAVAVAKDQPFRVQQCQAQQLVHSASLDACAICQTVRHALTQPLEQRINIEPGLNYVLDYFRSVQESV